MGRAWDCLQHFALRLSDLLSYLSYVLHEQGDVSAHPREEIVSRLISPAPGVLSAPDSSNKRGRFAQSAVSRVNRIVIHLQGKGGLARDLCAGKQDETNQREWQCGAVGFFRTRGCHRHNQTPEGARKIVELFCCECFNRSDALNGNNHLRTGLRRSHDDPVVCDRSQGIAVQD